MDKVNKIKKDLEKVKKENIPSTFLAIKVFSRQKTASKTESSTPESEQTTDTAIKQIESQFKQLQVNRIMKPKFFFFFLMNKSFIDQTQEQKSLQKFWIQPQSEGEHQAEKST